MFAYNKGRLLVLIGVPIKIQGAGLVVLERVQMRDATVDRSRGHCAVRSEIAQNLRDRIGRAVHGGQEGYILVFQRHERDC